MPMDGLPSSAGASAARMSNWNSGWLSIPPAVAPARFPLCHNALLSRGNCWVTAEAPSNPGAAEQDGASERDGAAHATRSRRQRWLEKSLDTAILPKMGLLVAKNDALSAFNP